MLATKCKWPILCYICTTLQFHRKVPLHLKSRMSFYADLFFLSLGDLSSSRWDHWRAIFRPFVRDRWEAYESEWDKKRQHCQRGNSRAVRSRKRTVTRLEEEDRIDGADGVDPVMVISRLLPLKVPPDTQVLPVPLLSPFYSLHLSPRCSSILSSSFFIFIVEFALSSIGLSMSKWIFELCGRRCNFCNMRVKWMII